MNIAATNLTRGVESRRYTLVMKLEALGYTEDRVGKQTKDMTLTELEQIYINVREQRNDL
ncbi:hypothetical protein [Halobacillus salinus]|uniref:Fur-regulated basic protein FbpA n=1 Tax=Halobacillus salinus TaxID=192814 RepID=A0A4Z0H425_9BACI|nr:hypothetical protein [Halobacillus salinus]TGB05178.1 hypothetical protein E4663_09350 [Halobacillus salinus]